jgi:hypothetical protein
MVQDRQPGMGVPRGHGDIIIPSSVGPAKSDWPGRAGRIGTGREPWVFAAHWYAASRSAE